LTTAIIGVGNIGKSVARHLVDGGERVVLAARDEQNATALAKELGELASATSVEKAITDDQHA
jgi:8-hydroxy-5-deazaflavin:NADPH oxidoreductase